MQITGETEKMYRSLVFLALLGGLSLSGVLAYSRGAVTPACSTMVPGHGSTPPQQSPPSFWVISSNSAYTADQEITVTLQANETAFKGFMLQARDAITGDGPLGTFRVMEKEAQLLSCGGEATAVSHTSASLKRTVQATWTPPPRGVRDVVFRATFVQNFNNFWVGVQSSRVTFTGVVPNGTLGITPNGSPSPSISLALLAPPLLLLALPNVS